MTTHRLFFLGAGFSHLAGLPLGTELFQLVRSKIRDQYGADNHVERDLHEFTKYLYECFGRRVALENVDLEEFLGFLDVEHYLGLRGKDTWSSEGNESQLMIRMAIAQVLHDLTPTPSRIPEAYRRFARQLNESDLIWTFNYDTLLERALECEGVSYRLFPLRYSEVDPMSCTVDPISQNELVVLKLHGSVDWFSRAHFDEFEEMVRRAPYLYPSNHQVSHPIFGHDAIVTPVPLVEGPRPHNESLKTLHRVRDLDAILSKPFWQCSPFILAPSTAKLFYARPLIEFWNGLQRAGGLHLSLCIIGYSLPKYDDYAIQAIYHIVRNYQHVEPNLTHNGRQKTKVRIIDFRPTPESAAELQDRYRFIDWNRAETRLDGFSEESVDWVLR
jgi:hypothetical protein